MKRKFFIIIIFLIAIIIPVLYSFTFATDSSLTLEGLKGKNVNDSALKAFGNTVIGIISVIGSVVSVIVLMIIGIKYMLGSVEEKATYKKSLMPYLIGAVIVFTASTIPSIIFKIVTEL